MVFDHGVATPSEGNLRPGPGSGDRGGGGGGGGGRGYKRVPVGASGSVSRSGRTLVPFFVH